MSAIEKKTTPNDTTASLANQHFSQNVQMDHWLRLLVVVATILLLFGFVAAVIRLLAAVKHTLLLFALGGLLAYAVYPLVEWLRHRTKLSQAGAVFSVYGGFVVLLALALALLGTALVHQVNLIVLDHSTYQQGMAADATPQQRQLAEQTYEAKLHKEIDRLNGWLAARGVHYNLHNALRHPLPNTRALSNGLLEHVVRAIGGVGRALFEITLVVLISIYFLVYCEEMRRRFTMALPPALQAYASIWQDDVNHVLGGFVRGQLLLALIIGTSAGLLCLLLGMRFWLLLGLFIMVVSLIPVLGPYIGAIPTVLAALITPTEHGLTPLARALIVLVVLVVINEIGSKILYPRLVGAALGLHEVLVLFLILGGLEVAGITGMFFAAPLTALIVTTLPQLYRFWQGLPPVSLTGRARQASPLPQDGS